MALLCIKLHGPNALYYAKGRIEELRDQGAAGAAMWVKVAAVLEEMQRERRPEDAVN
jgi:hypothetical protein